MKNQSRIPVSDRLFSLVLATLMTLLVSSVGAQAQDTAYYTIAGDLPQPQACGFPAGQQVHVLELLAKAGLPAPEGNALVLRGLPIRRVFSENLWPQMTHQGTVLVPGDVVVFRSLKPSAAIQKNALLIADGLPEIVRFKEGDGILIGQVIDARSGLPHQLSVTRTDFGTAHDIVLSPRDEIQHGDIIRIQDDSNQGGLRISSIAHSSVKAASESTTQEHTLRIPAESDTAISADPVEDFLPATNATVPGQPEMSIDESPAATANNVLHTVSYEGVSEETSQPGTDAASRASAPLGNSPLASANMTKWNALFLLGLVFALGLIVIGWVKTQQERQAESMATRNSQILSGIAEQEFIAAEKRPSKNGDKEFSGDVASVGFVPETTQHETVTNDDVAVLSVGIECSGPEIQSDCLAVSDELGAAITRAEDQPAIATETRQQERPLVSEHEWFGGDWFNSREEIVSVDNHKSSHQNDNLSTPGRNSLTDDSPVTEPARNLSEDCWSDLEDLIRNRLPIEIKQTDLPLRIALYGKPSGPRRLRIDSAHAQIAPPHMTTGARTPRHREPGTAETSNSGVDIHTVNSVKTPGSNDSGRFDRALNFLEELADS